MKGIEWELSSQLQEHMLSTTHEWKTDYIYNYGIPRNETNMQ